MSSRQDIVRRIAIAAAIKKKAAEVESAAKLELAEDMARGSEAVVDDEGREIGMVLIPRATKPKPVVEIDESVVIPWMYDEDPDAVEEIVRLREWARKDVITRVLAAHAAGSELPAGTAVSVPEARKTTARYTASEEADVLIAGMYARGQIDLGAVLAIGGAQ
ncbi:hypothetical protein G4X40_18710 [Rhodococcus sp. D2-41]|uniref:hypothetical protein n=1 Tax=Speluncibacter jeojiensis TaxID=2710754 RepID=UPI00240ECE20|nr:hypothetical protein [Rhodococcus sp. D2-41]MDG3012176.1 hypothetical protein [Rhodococcus sp. D2-41]